VGAATNIRELTPHHYPFDSSVKKVVELQSGKEVVLN